MSTKKGQQKLSFSDRLRIERDRLGISQAELGENGGVSRVTQGAYESGRRSPDAAYLLAVAVFSGVDVQYVITGVRSANLHQVMEDGANYKTIGAGPLNKRESDLVLKYRELSAADQRHLVAVLEALANREGSI